MFIGHYGVAFAGKKIDDKPSLGTLFLAAQFLDVLWPVFILVGLERVAIDPLPRRFLTLHFTSYPYSHSLVAAIFWSLVFAIVYYFIKKNLRVSVVLGALVFSHWVLDLIVHVPDLPLIPGIEIKVGLGLWNSTAMDDHRRGHNISSSEFYFILGPRERKIYGEILHLWSLIIFLVFVYIINLIGPPPPSVTALGIVGLSQWLIIAWAYWADKNRERAT